MYLSREMEMVRYTDITRLVCNVSKRRGVWWTVLGPHEHEEEEEVEEERENGDRTFY